MYQPHLLQQCVPAVSTAARACVSAHGLKPCGLGLYVLRLTLCQLQQEPMSAKLSVLHTHCVMSSADASAERELTCESCCNTVSCSESHTSTFECITYIGQICVRASTAGICECRIHILCCVLCLASHGLACMPLCVYRLSTGVRHVFGAVQSQRIVRRGVCTYRMRVARLRCCTKHKKVSTRQKCAHTAKRWLRCVKGSNLRVFPHTLSRHTP